MSQYPEALPYQGKPRRRAKRSNVRRDHKDAGTYKRVVAKLKASDAGAVCHICQQPIDRTLPTSESSNPLYWTADHQPPLSQRERNANGQIIDIVSGLLPAHRGCNSSEGAGTKHQAMPRATNAGKGSWLKYEDGLPVMSEDGRSWALTRGGWTTTPDLVPSDPMFIQHSRAW